jgi:hypothetical protein
MRASIGLVGSELVTWPQLASGVNLGGASAADAVRRIMLEQLRVSGRWFVDLSSIVTDLGPVMSLHTE